MTTWTFIGAPNGDGHRIIVPTATGPITEAPIAEGYSRWKDWVQAGNANWPEAFSNTIGGNDLGGGQFLDGYFFIRNDLGWRIRPDEADGQLDIAGNLFPFDPLTPFLVPTIGDFTVTVRQVLSSRAIVDTGGGGGGSIDYDRIRDDIVPHIWASRLRRWRWWTG